MPDSFAPLSNTPYYAVIFSNQLADNAKGYGEMADAMVASAQTQPGFLGVESTRGVDGFGITVSYWKDETSMIAWKGDAQHLLAQKLGKTRWYDHYCLRVARIERQYCGPDGR